MTKDKTGSENALSKRGGAAPAEGAAMSSRSEIAAFLTAAKSVVPASAGGSGRLAFALDATMSRQPTWDSACKLQAEMFDAVGKTANAVGATGLFPWLGECRASRWVNDTRQLADLMTGIDCRGGQTQIGRVLRHVADEAKDRPVSALVYIGDAMEEDIDKLAVVQESWRSGKSRVSCFTKVMIRPRPLDSARSPGSPAVPMSGSTRTRHRNSQACSGRWPPMPPAAGLRWRSPADQRRACCLSNCQGNPRGRSK
jgi:hypothetical protein